MTDVEVGIFETDKARVFVIDEQGLARSRCWYFCSLRDAVYIGPDATGGTLKLSFHANDGCSRDGCNSQWGLPRDYAEEERQLGTPKLPPLARWKRPETPPTGFAQVASIMFPTGFLCGTIPPFKPGQKRIALPLAPPGHAIEIGIFYSREDPSTVKAGLSSAGGKSIGYMSLPGGEHVIVAAREVPFEAAAIPLAHGLESVGHALSGAPKAGEVIDNCGAVLLLNRPADGEIVTLAEINGVTTKRNC
jgi:hypothetical protein